MEKDALSVKIGNKLRKIRQLRGLTLEGLAELTSVSKPMLGQIERGVSNPTVATLWKIASGLNVPFTSFVDDAPTVHTIRANEQPAFYEDDRRYQVFSTFSLAGGLVEVFRLLLLPGCKRSADPHADGVVETLTVAAGKCCIHVSDTMHQLQSGDAIQFAANVNHAYENPFTEACEAHLVIVYPDPRGRRDTF